MKAAINFVLVVFVMIFNRKPDVLERCEPGRSLKNPAPGVKTGAGKIR